MAERNRYLNAWILKTLNKKMAFIGGARQVGKTTLSVAYLDSKNKKDPGYLSWDSVKSRKLLIAGELPAGVKTLVFDEIHKYQKWRNLIKGFYDQHSEEFRFLVTGSARLDYYRRGGDSLLGRYRYFRLHPFTLAEVDASCPRSLVPTLLKFGGFPEPLFSQSETELRIWQRERQSRLLREDLVDLEQVKSLSQVQILADLLPSKVASPLSLQSLREDIQVSHDAVSNWLRIFELLYLTFRISPFGPPKTKALKKEQKLYFWDWSVVRDKGAQFENLVASHLLKYCHFIEDTEGFEMDLRYYRDLEKREVDFVVLKEGKPHFMVECKTGEKGVSPHLCYLLEKTGHPVGYQVHLGVKDTKVSVRGSNKHTVRIIPFEKWVKELQLP